MDTILEQARATVAESDLNDVVKLLEELGSSQDPIFYQGEETTPEELSYQLGWDTNPAKLRISFYGAKPKNRFGLRRNSTFVQMLADRMKMRVVKNREKKRQERRPVVEYVVQWSEYIGYDKPRTHTEVFPRRTEAKRFYIERMTRHSSVKFFKVTKQLLAESDE